MKTYATRLRGEIRYVADLGTSNGQRHREYYRTEAEAKKAIREAKKALALSGRWWATIRNDDRLEYIAALKEMLDGGMHPADLWEAYRSGEAGIPHQRRTLTEAIDETILAKREAGRKGRYVKELEQYLRKFAKTREDLPIHRITPADIDKWFAHRKEGPETRKSNLGRLSSMFGLCHRRGYIPSNPCKAAEQVSIDRKPPAILQVPELSKLLKLCRKQAPAMLRYMVLGGLLGIRPDELQQMDAGNVNLKRKRVTIDFHTSKIRAWRIIDLPSNVIAWLKVCPKAHGKVAPSRTTARRARRKLRDALGMPKWVPDVLRHSAASYLLAYYEDEAKVAAMLGTSPRILHQRYRALVSRESAKQFMALRP